jgi:hypothetical protein
MLFIGCVAGSIGCASQNTVAKAEKSVEPQASETGQEKSASEYFHQFSDMDVEIIEDSQMSKEDFQAMGHLMILAAIGSRTDVFNTSFDDREISFSVRKNRHAGKATLRVLSRRPMRVLMVIGKWPSDFDLAFSRQFDKEVGRIAKTNFIR